MEIELTEKQKAGLLDDLVTESSTEELEKMICKLIKEYYRFHGSDMRKIQTCLNRYFKAKDKGIDGFAVPDGYWDDI